MLVDGPRACHGSEFDEVISLINQVFREGTDQDIRTDYPLVFDPSRAEYMRVLKVDGKVVSHVPVAPREVVAADDRFTIGIISPTVTHPDYRRRGYATRCLLDCVSVMEEQAWPVSVLWTQEATFPFYQRSGWEAVGSQGWVYRLGSEELDLFEGRSAFEVVRYDEGNAHHLEAIIEIHDAEPNRIARSRSDYRALFSLPKTTTYLAAKYRKPAAYLMVGAGTNKPGLIEGGGDAEGLEVLVGHAVEQAAGKGTQVLTPFTPTALGKLMEAKKPGSRRPIEEAQGVGYQMMRVNSLEGLLRQIADHLRSRSKGVSGSVCLACSDTGEAVTLVFRDGDVDISARRSADPVVLSRRQLASLIFGHHAAVTPPELEAEAGEILREVFPLYFPIWELDHS